MSPSTVNRSSPFRPLRWIGWAAGACVAAYLFGLASATPASAPIPAAPSVICTP
jgi:hypothetical protein